MSNIIQALGVCYVPAELFELTAGQQTKYATPNSSQAQVFVLGRQVFLSNSQAIILDFLLKRPGGYCSRNELLDTIPGSDDCDDRMIDTAIKRLRRKLFPNSRASGMLFIQTKYVLGYRIPTREQLKNLGCP